MVGYAREPRAYELMVMIVPDISDEEIAEELGRISGFVNDIEATIKEVLTDSPWGRRRLAYTIRHNSVDYRDGYYAIYHFDARPNAITDLERELKLDVRVIRYLLVHDDPKWGSANVNSQEGASAGEANEEPETAGAPAATAAPATAVAATSEAVTANEAPAAPETAETAPAESAPSTDAAPAASTDTEASTETESAPAERAESTEPEAEAEPATAPAAPEGTTEEE